MALVRCSNCNKETNNEKENCLWCNKKLDKNLNPIESKLSKVKKKPEIKKHWICEECQEENELSFDRCWKCGTESEIAKTKHQEFLKKEKEEKLIQQEVKELELEIKKYLKAERWASRGIAILSTLVLAELYFSFLWPIFVKYLPETPIYDLIGNALLMISGIFWLGIGLFVYKIVYSYFILKKIKKLGFDKHKYYDRLKQ